MKLLKIIAEIKNVQTWDISEPMDLTKIRPGDIVYKKVKYRVIHNLYHRLMITSDLNNFSKADNYIDYSTLEKQWLNEIKMQRKWDLQKPGINAKDIKVGDIILFDVNSAIDKIDYCQQLVVQTFPDRQKIKTCDIQDGQIMKQREDWWTYMSLETWYQHKDMK